MTRFECIYEKDNEKFTIKASGLFAIAYFKAEHKQELKDELIFRDNNLLKGKIIHRIYK